MFTKTSLVDIWKYDHAAIASRKATIFNVIFRRNTSRMRCNNRGSLKNNRSREKNESDRFIRAIITALGI